MAGLILTHRRGNHHTPFSLARELFAWEPQAWPQITQTKATQPAAPPRFTPQFNVVETADDIIIEADLPGISEDAIELTVNGRDLSIKGSRVATATEEGNNIHIFERSFGQFSRQFTLPDSADTSAIAAALKDGVLKVTVGKIPEEKPRKIPLTLQA